MNILYKHILSALSPFFSPRLCFCRRPMLWSYEKDIDLCREIVLIQPYKFKEKTREKGKAWQDISDNPNSLPGFTVSARAVRERLKLLEIKFKKKDRQERAASGISPEMTELDVLLEDLYFVLKNSS